MNLHVTKERSVERYGERLGAIEDPRLGTVSSMVHFQFSNTSEHLRFQFAVTYRSFLVPWHSGKSNPFCTAPVQHLRESFLAAHQLLPASCSAWLDPLGDLETALLRSLNVESSGLRLPATATKNEIHHLAFLAAVLSVCAAGCITAQLAQKLQAKETPPARLDAQLAARLATEARCAACAVLPGRRALQPV